MVFGKIGLGMAEVEVEEIIQGGPDDNKQIRSLNRIQ